MRYFIVTNGSSLGRPLILAAAAIATVEAAAATAAVAATAGPRKGDS